MADLQSGLGQRHVMELAVQVQSQSLVGIRPLFAVLVTAHSAVLQSVSGLLPLMEQVVLAQCQN